jgi:hypothetical protein
MTDTYLSRAEICRVVLKKAPMSSFLYLPRNSRPSSFLARYGYLSVTGQFAELTVDFTVRNKHNKYISVTS